MAAFVSRKEAAERCGWSRQRIEKLIKDGRVVETDEGVDLEQALATKATMLNVTAAVSGDASGAGQSPSDAKLTHGDTRRAYRVRRGAHKTAESKGELLSFADARTKREMANAELAELKYLEASGRLISIDEVKAKEFEVARKLRDRILGFPAKVQPLLPPEAMQLIIDECDALVRELQEDASRIAERSPG